MSENSIKQLESKREGEELMRKITENNRLEEVKQKQEHKKNQLHHDDLMGQIRYNSSQRQLQSAHDEREWQAEMAAEKEYRIKLEDALSKPDVQKIHPTRNAIISRNSAGLNVTGRGARSGGFVH